MTEGTGYKRPPVASRWTKGQSGNPTGRKKGTPNLKTDLEAELAEFIQINEGGSPRRITKQRALLKSLAARGIQGDTKASNLILNLVLTLLGTAPSDPVPTPVSAEDEAIVKAFLERANAKQGELK